MLRSLSIRFHSTENIAVIGLEKWFWAVQAIQSI